MTDMLSKEYRVNFICSGLEGDRDWRVDFVSGSPESVKNIVSACAAYNSGDDCQCFINGEEVVLEGDWGLL